MKRDPNVSQVSLTGSWVLSQFRTLIDEREEARRNYEQLRAEIGSIRSAFSEQLNDPSTKAKLNPSEVTEEDSMKISSVQLHQHDIKPSESKIQESSVHAVASAAPAEAVPTSLTKQSEPSPKPTNPEKPSTNDHQTFTSDCAKEVAGIVLLGFGAILCFPCLPFYFTRRRKATYHHPSKQPKVYEMSQPIEPESAPYTYGPVRLAHENLNTYGPEGLFEMSDALELPPPAPLDSSYLAQVDGGRHKL
jgi:hypothetical protein